MAASTQVDKSPENSLLDSGAVMCEKLAVGEIFHPDYWYFEFQIENFNFFVRESINRE